MKLGYIKTVFLTVTHIYDKRSLLPSLFPQSCCHPELGLGLFRSSMSISLLVLYGISLGFYWLPRRLFALSSLTSHPLLGLSFLVNQQISMQPSAQLYRGYISIVVEYALAIPWDLSTIRDCFLTACWTSFLSRKRSANAMLPPDFYGI